MTIDISRRVQLDRCRKLLKDGASLDHVLGMAWNYGFIEGDRDTETLELEFDARVREINTDAEAPQ